MKMRVELDCTPEEAREFLGLPDLRPLQATVMAQVEKQMLDTASAFSSPDALLRTWLSLLPQGPEQMLDLFGRFFGPRPGSGSP